MSRPARKSVVALVAHARQVPATERERFAGRLHDHLGTRALIVETCHRVEAYTTEDGDSQAPALADMLPAGGRVLAGHEAVRHAVSVAAGRDSVILGEDQVLHQLRGSLAATRTRGALDPEIDRLFTLALQAGRRARSWRSRPQRSLADLAIEVIERTIGPVRGDRILVVGAGQMGALAVRASVMAGASVTIANRSPLRARDLATRAGGAVTDLDPGPEAAAFAAIVVALGGPWDLEPSTIAAVIGRDPVIVDLSVPTAVPTALADGLRRGVVTADDLARFEADGSSGPAAADPRTDELISRTVDAFIEWQSRGDARAAADALVRHADLEREAELTALFRKLPELEPEAREAIDGMARHLAARLLREPLERLGRDPDGPEGQIVRDLFAL